MLPVLDARRCRLELELRNLASNRSSVLLLHLFKQTEADEHRERVRERENKRRRTEGEGEREREREGER